VVTVGVDDSSLQADAQAKLVDLVWGVVATWHCATFNRWTG